MLALGVSEDSVEMLSLGLIQTVDFLFGLLSPFVLGHLLSAPVGLL